MENTSVSIGLVIIIKGAESVHPESIASIADILRTSMNLSNMAEESNILSWRLILIDKKWPNDVPNTIAYEHRCTLKASEL